MEMNQLSRKTSKIENFWTEEGLIMNQKTVKSKILSNQKIR